MSEFYTLEKLIDHADGIDRKLHLIITFARQKPNKHSIDYYVNLIKKVYEQKEYDEL